MTNVKVHLKEITKYVLLLGLLIQMVLGLICCVLWLFSEDAAGRCQSLGGVLICALLGYLFLKSRRIGDSKKKLFVGTVGIVTSPMVLQAGLGMERESVPAYVLVLVFIIFPALCHKAYRKWKKISGVALLVVVAVICCNMGQNISFAAKIADRCCYPYVLDVIYTVPQELLDETGYLELRESLRSSDGMETLLYPHLLEVHGNAREADKVCYRLAAFGLENHTKSVAKDIIWDYAGYHFPQLIAELQLRGYGGEAITGYRYLQLTDRSGYIGTLYWIYSVVWYVLATALMMIVMLPKSIKSIKGEVGLLLLLEVVILCLVLQGAGLFDYTKLLIVPFLWVGMVLKMAGVDCGDK